MMEVLRVFGGSITDTIYSMDFGFGEINWNVTKIQKLIEPGRRIERRECGIRLKRWKPPMPEIDHRWRENCDLGKIEHFKTRPDILNIPLIGIGIYGPDGLEHRCFCDGNHRLIAMCQLGYTTFSFHYVPPEIEENFRVNFVVSK